MSETAASLLARFQALPRAMRWLSYAVLVTAAVLLWDATVRPLVETWDGRADEIQTQVRSVRNSSNIALELRRKRETIVAIGPVAKPGSEDDGRSALTRIVTAVLTRHPVSNPSFDLAAGSSTLPRGVQQGVLPAHKRLETLSGNLKFEATPEMAIAVIADFEKRPDIEDVSRMHMTKMGDGKVKVSLTLETWVAGDRKRRS